MHKKQQQAGFSLVELSVVLVIIAILIGGVLGGRSLLQSSRNLTVISDLQKYTAATNSYFTKYGYWPGDDAEATSKWSGTTNGNGDGALGASASDQEFMYFWQDLYEAKFVEAKFTGAWGSVPRPSIPESYLTHHYSNAATQAFYITGRNPATNSAVGSTAEANFTPIMPIRSAFAIDKKLDDGAAGTGIIRSKSAANTDCVYSTAATVSCNLYYIYKQ